MNTIISKYFFSFNPKIIGHVVCWFLFISYELGVLYLVNGHLEKPYIYVVFYGINISFFYIYAGLLGLIFYKKNLNYLLGALVYIALVFSFILIKCLADYILATKLIVVYNPMIYIQDYIARNITRFLYFTILATCYWFAGYVSYSRKMKLEAELKQLKVEKEKVDLEGQLAASRNAYLQQQINPHMLFNALNFVYSSAQKYSDEAANCIWLLAEIMRFSLEETGSDGKIELVLEAEQIDNLLALNRYRFNEPLNIKVEMSGNFSQLRIIPLILMTLTENVFKHGNLLEKSHPAIIRIQTYEDGKLTFFSHNLKKSMNEHRRSRQLGLQNVRIRLDSIYPENYQLEIKEPGEFYEMTLTINLCS